HRRMRRTHPPARRPRRATLPNVFRGVSQVTRMPSPDRSPIPRAVLPLAALLLAACAGPRTALAPPPTPVRQPASAIVSSASVATDVDWRDVPLARFSDL